MKPRTSRQRATLRGPSLGEVRETVGRRMQEVADLLAAEGLPVPALDGKLLRPLTAYLSIPRERRTELDSGFWSGCLAVEMVHEASLLHDDILDDAPQRRGRPTMAARAGVGPALVMGDHLLTAAYRAAAAAGSTEFLELFIRSVERTVAGEIAQERSQGSFLAEEEYRRVITGKSGELFRSAFALAPYLIGIGSADRAGEIGARLGMLYQMVDDLLDYCPAAERGKVPLQDYRQKKWTWPLSLIEISDFRMPEREVLSRLFGRDGFVGRAAMEAGFGRIEDEAEAIVRDLVSEGLAAEGVEDLLQEWVDLARGAIEREVEAEEASASVLPRVDNVPAPSLWTAGGREARLRKELRGEAAGLASHQDFLDYFGRHATSFRFASRLFPPEPLRRIAGVYAFCRFTDDLVDEAGDEDPSLTGERLDVWCAMAREAYEGKSPDVPLLDEVMGGMRTMNVPFHYAEELVQGVQMDLKARRYRTLDDLRVYSYRVASVVGGWLTELFGVRDEWVLQRAYALGQAMQLTNILRDVGEDLRRGRLYLPEDWMARYGVDRDLLEAKARNRAPAFPGYRSLLEGLMAEADAEYERAFEGIRSLPSFFQAPVAVAASVYQGIHDEIRRNAYDNLNRRARTSWFRKILLGARGLLELRRRSRRPHLLEERRLQSLAYVRKDEGREVAA